MAITASGLFFTTFEDSLDNDTTFDLAADSHKVALFTNSTTTPNFGTNTAYGSAPFNANEVGSPAGGVALASVTVTLDTTSGVRLKFDAADTAWGSQSISGIRAALIYDTTVSNTCVCLVDLTTDYAVTSGVFTLQWASGGIFYIQLAS